MNYPGKYNNGVRIEDFDYALPQELIAQEPSPRRDGSRLMVVDRANQTIEHRLFKGLPQLLTADDLLVLNDSRVFPARLLGRLPTGGRVEVLLLEEHAPRLWEALVRPGRKVRPGTRLTFTGLTARVEDSRDSRRMIRFDYEGDFRSWVEAQGQMPLPPYVRRAEKRSTDLDRDRYQTIYARSSGSIAAPTAGLHFTPSLLKRLPHEFVTLHVGYGTFQPVQTQEVEDHRMSAEVFEVSRAAAEHINQHRGSGRRIVAVGSTSTRVLESLWQEHGEIREGRGSTALFITPGFRFSVVGAMLTNFHLPRSTLILLVSAFAGRDLILDAYRQAVEYRYRFYSYGDAMLIV